MADWNGWTGMVGLEWQKWEWRIFNGGIGTLYRNGGRNGEWNGRLR